MTSRIPKGQPAGGLQTEWEFTLPLGYVDTHGGLHKQGKMRLATAMDEIAPLRDPRVKANPAYLVIILLSRVITELGTVEVIETGVIERLFAADLSYLQEFYRTINALPGDEEIVPTENEDPLG